MDLDPVSGGLLGDMGDSTVSAEALELVPRCRAPVNLRRFDDCIDDFLFGTGAIFRRFVLGD